MEENEEDDYMSDTFLNNDNNIRPGLLMTHNQQRLHQQMKKKIKTELLDKSKSIKILEQKNRQDGLEKAIDSSNKGFSLLEKMGYKPGLGIGKNGSGRIDPVGIVLKNDRKGLGRDAAIKEIREMKKAMIQKRLLCGLSVNVTEYRERKAQLLTEKQDQSDLYRCQRICRQMDLEKDIQEPLEKFLWPEDPNDKQNDEIVEEIDIEDKMSVSEQLEIVNVYLRKTYNYCVYCGTVYNNDDDLTNECPGPKRQDH